ncbi:hypothetical protein PINS_up018366 [Pythium insidiosum]|nr:hypothetical protein PINS_up018366 [Pythium insidiosum]
MAAGDVLRHRVSLIEAREQRLSNATGSLASQYEWISVQVVDPKSRLFASQAAARWQRQSDGTVDMKQYARETRSALALWLALARCKGYSARENASFWRRVLQELLAPGQRDVSDVPRFFESTTTAFPRFCLTFCPKDCYDEELDEPEDATQWMQHFIDTFFEEESAKGAPNTLDMMAQELSPTRTTSQPSQLQLVFRSPMLRTHGPTGATHQLHPGYLEAVRAIAEQVNDRSTLLRTGYLRVIESVVALRGSLRLQDIVTLAPTLQSTALQVSELCVDLNEEAQQLDAAQWTRVTSAFKHIMIKGTLTVNVAKANALAIQRLQGFLVSAPRISSVRLFNVFTGSTTERREKWRRLGDVLAHSTIKELVLERAQFSGNDVESLSQSLQNDARAYSLESLVIKPLANEPTARTACIALAKAFHRTLRHIDIACVDLQSTDVDAVLDVCSSLASLRLGAVEALGESRLVQLLSAPTSRIRSLALTCSEDALSSLVTALSHHSFVSANAAQHLTELSVDTEDIGESCATAIATMLETNHAITFIAINRRSRSSASHLLRRIDHHHNSALVRKLPIAHKLAFLSVITADATSVTALGRFDAGIASEILAFAGHSETRRLRHT